MTLAIYRGSRKWIVREWRAGRPGLWAILGAAYTRETARALADRLNRDER